MCLSMARRCRMLIGSGICLFIAWFLQRWMQNFAQRFCVCVRANVFCNYTGRAATGGRPAVVRGWQVTHRHHTGASSRVHDGDRPCGDPGGCTTTAWPPSSSRPLPTKVGSHSHKRVGRSTCMQTGGNFFCQ